MSRTRRQRRDRARAGLPPLTPADALRGFLEQMRAAAADAGLFASYAYSGAADFLLRHSKEYAPAPLPPGITPGVPRHCWERIGLTYLGVEFSLERADDCSWYGDGSVLDDWKRDWPIFREPWTGEKPIPGYKPSPALVSAYKLACGDTEGAAEAWRQALSEAQA